MKKKWMNLFWVMAVLIVSACATSPSSNKEQAGTPSNILVDQLAQEIAGAKADNVDTMAPDLFSKAQAAYQKARQGLDRGERSTAINEDVVESRNYLAQAQAVAAAARRILKETNTAREKAIAAGAEDLGQPFKDVEARYRWLTQAIKNNDIDYAVKNAESVQANYRNVEIMAIKHGALAPCRQLMEKANRQRLDKTVPRTYGQAVQALNEADEYIGNNPYEEKLIADKAGHALFLAQRLMAVNGESQKMDAMASEERALYVEDHLSKLSGALDAGDLRNLAPEKQVSVMSEKVGELQTNNRSLTQLNQSYQKQIVAMEQRIQGLEGFSQEQEAAKKRLASEREFNERFNKVQNYFTSKEAEVYKQGNQLVIRMRGIQFPVGQATLTPDNYSLLSKVQRAIRTFESVSVIIEGHTDNTGSNDLNKSLSLERARAVQAYLVANDADMVDRISARGYGSDRPLASNDTPAGRAVNRRIDVLIKPNPFN